MESAHSYQVGGKHYQKDIQPWDIIDCWHLDFYRGNALKYLLRNKVGGDPVEDLEKAIHYLKKAKENLLREIGGDFDEPHHVSRAV